MTEQNASVEYGIVLGCPRSGTTYLMSVLEALPSLECMNGTLLSVTTPHVASQNLDPPVYNALVIGFERALNDYLHSGRYHSRTRSFQRWVHAPSNLGALRRALFGGQRPLPDVMVYKEPFLSFAPKFVLDAFPNGRLIHLYRDGRDCANSLRRKYDVFTDEKLTTLKASEMRIGRRYDERYVPWWVAEGRDQEFIEASPFVRAVWMWKDMVRRCYETLIGTEGDMENVLHVCYEDLVRNPHEQGQRLLDHLGVSGTPAFDRRLSQARTDSIGKHTWRSSTEIEHANRLARNELNLYGYDATSSSMSADHHAG